jgi:hypothetical protein
MGTVSNWLAEAGASNPIFHNYSSTASSDTVVNDQGSPALDVNWPGNGNNTLGTNTCLGCDTSTALYTSPVANYTETRFRISSTAEDTCGNSPGLNGSGNCLIADIWSIDWSNGANEWDLWEQSGGTSYQPPGGCGCVNAAFTSHDPPSAAGVSYPAGTDFSVYHTVGLLTTSDGSGHFSTCLFLDPQSAPNNGFLGCTGSQGLNNTNARPFIIFSGSGNGGPNPGDLYIQYERVFYCSSGASSQCNGTLKTSWP